MEMCNICKIKAPLNLSFINSNLNGVFVMSPGTKKDAMLFFAVGLEPAQFIPHF